MNAIRQDKNREVISEGESPIKIEEKINDRINRRTSLEKSEAVWQQ